MRFSTAKILLSLAILHIVFTAVHSAAHIILGVMAPPLDTVFIVVVIILAPIIGVAILRRRPAWGALLLALSLLGSFAYGGYYHFLDSGHDNVHHVTGGAWAGVFGATAWMLAVIDSAGTLAGFRALYNSAPPRKTRPKGNSMIRPLLLWIIDRAERKLRVSMDYLRYVARVHPAVVMKFSRIQGPASYRKFLAPDLFHVAHIATNRVLDCGACVQIAVNMALGEGMDREMVRTAALGSPAEVRERLAPPLAEVWEFAQAVMRDAPEQDALREAVKARLGDQAFCELALAITMTATFPTMKRALGYAISCSKVHVDV